MDQEEKTPDQPSQVESFLKRMAESLERIERKQPPEQPQQPQGGVQVNPPTVSQPEEKTPQFANAGLLNISAPQGQQQPSIFGRAAISLQSMTNSMADYGVQSPMAHSLTSYAKVASLMAGDTHTRGEGLSAKGLRPNTGGDENQILRSMELISKSRNQGDTGDASPQIARNDLKDSLDSLKESIDQLREALRQNGQAPKPSGKTVFRQAEATKPQTAAERRSRPTQLGGIDPQAVQGLIAAFRL